MASRGSSGALRYRWLEEAGGAADMAQVRALFNASLSLDDAIGFPGPIAAGGESSFFEGLRFDLAHARKEILLVHAEDDELVAMVILARDGQPNCRHIAEISKCIIHPSRRGQGILKAGFRILLQRCRRDGIDVLTLDVRKGSRAEKLWRILGFQPFGELPDYARVKGQTHAGLYLWANVDLLETVA